MYFISTVIVFKRNIFLVFFIGRSPLLAACDVYRPAAADQLATLGGEIGVPVFRGDGEHPVDIAKGAIQEAVDHLRDVVIVDTPIKDGRVISLIHRYLYAGVMVNGVYQPTTEGTPQGGPLSPLLSNIVLNEMDKELESRGHPFVRYADDSLIFCKSKRGAERVCESPTRFIEKKLHLKVNREKTEVGYVRGMKFLGYSFYKTGEG